MQPRAKFKRKCTHYNEYPLTGAFLSRVVVVYDPRAGVLICAPCSVITVSFLGTTTGPHSTEAGALPSMRLAPRFHPPCSFIDIPDTVVLRACPGSPRAPRCF
jgi:hypothetical protein